MNTYNWNRTWTKVKETSPRRNGHGSFFEPKRQYECLFQSKFSDWAFSTWLSRQYRCCLYDSWQQRKVRKYTELWKHWPQSPQERIVDRSVIELQSFNLEQRGLLSNEAPFFCRKRDQQSGSWVWFKHDASWFLLRATDQCHLSTCLKPRYQQFTQLLSTQLTTITKTLDS